MAGLVELFSNQCVTNYGQTACGYHCIAAHGHVECARTSAGICGTTSTNVYCWDPPDWVRALYSRAEERVPRPSCVVRSGNIACGFGCTAQDSRVACATSPEGVCRSTGREILCWDPDPSTYCSDAVSLLRPECITLDGAIACGYQCFTRNGQLACAKTPDGRCFASGDGIACTDPEAPPMCGYAPCQPDGKSSTRSWCRAPEARSRANGTRR